MDAKFSATGAQSPKADWLPRALLQGNFVPKPSTLLSGYHACVQEQTGGVNDE